MRLCISLLNSALLFLALPVSAALAGDFPQGELRPADFPDDGFHGNVHASAGLDTTFGATQVYSPYVNVGGKGAYEFVGSAWGMQADVDGKYSNLSWSLPQVAGQSGNQSEIDSAIHATYAYDPTKKFGLFTGYSSRSITLNTATTGNVTTFGMQGVGAEGMMLLGPSTTAQLRAAVLVPIYDSVVINNGLTTTTTGGTGPDFGHLGYMVGASASRQLWTNVSARLDATYANFLVKDVGSNITEMNAQLTAQYSFENLPLTYGATIGYGRETIQGASTDVLSATSRLTYSFGGAPQGTRGRLFKSGVLGWAN